MKIKSAALRNFAQFDKVTVDFDPTLTYLIGKNGSGKSTIGINAIVAALQGIAERSSGGNQPLIGERFRFIGNNGPSSDIVVTLVDEKRGNAEIAVTRKITKSGASLNITAPDDYGEELNQEWLNNLFNMFLLAPKKFTELAGKEQAKVLGIDTSSIDADIAVLKQEFTGLNRDLKLYANLQYVPETKPVDTAALIARKKELNAELQRKYEENKKANRELRNTWNLACAEVDERNDSAEEIVRKTDLEIVACQNALKVLQDHGYDGQEVPAYIAKMMVNFTNLQKTEPLKRPDEPKYIDPEMPPTDELDALDEQLNKAAETNLEAHKYEQYKRELALKNVIVAKIDKNKADQKKKEQERVDYIKAFKLPFKNLSIDEDGSLMANGRPLTEQYFSSGELMRMIPILLAQRNPEFKYVFLQDFADLDEDNQAIVIKELTGKGFQLVIEKVDKKKVDGKKSILLKNAKLVDTYDEESEDLSPSL